MKTLMMKIPLVAECKAGECVYNKNQRCHAHAITIGDENHPACDTYFRLTSSADQHVDNPRIIAGVGACKVGSCHFNSDFECIAEDISIGRDNGRIACMSYLKK